MRSDNKGVDRKSVKKLINKGTEKAQKLSYLLRISWPTNFYNPEGHHQTITGTPNDGHRSLGNVTNIRFDSLNGIKKTTVTENTQLILDRFSCRIAIFKKKKKKKKALAGVAQWIEHGLWTKGSPVQFPIRAHAWVVGQVPSGATWEATAHYFSPSLFRSLPLSLKINK